MIGALSLLAVLLLASAQGASAKGKGGKLEIDVLSTRADLISGGEALIAISGTDTLRGLEVKAAGKQQGKRFDLVDGMPQGVVTGLPEGSSRIVARQGRRGTRLRVTNHPSGGPVFSGPQLQPWTCQDGAVDEQCNQPPTFTYIYMPSGGGGFQSYDRESPPSDIATTTTDEGVKVPFIVRVEKGYIDRDQYAIAMLYQPDQPWSATQPQQQFNHKLLITHGAACGVDYETGDAPGITTGAAETALGRGFATMSTALDNSGHNCNLALQAESLQMTKEHLIDSYGSLRYTIGTGCSGGSLAEQWIANAYPGIYQGILPTCSFPDAWSTATQFLDYHLTLAYFLDPSKWGQGVAWSPTQMADVQGHISILNSQVSDSAQFHVVVPTDPCAGVTDEERYSTSNPGGVRCSIADAAINLFGPSDESRWTPEEQAAGHGFAGIPIDNVGVQYGLDSLQRAAITPAQFVDLNVKMGGLDRANIEPTAERIAADQPALANAYRTGMINEANNLDETAIIDCRGPDPGAFHDAYRAFAMRARLDREHGGHGNQVIWEGPVPILGDAKCEVNSFIEMDEWLGAVEQDHSNAPLARKIVRDRPEGLGDRCYSGAGQKLSDDLCGEAVVGVYRTPRMVAGDALTTDTNKCRLKPLDRNADYGPLPFTDAQWTELESVFPSGVCDYSKPGVDQQGTIPWQTYQKKDGSVIYGGKPMGPEPQSKRIKRKR